MGKILARGHSRVPVYSGHPKNIIGLLLVSIVFDKFQLCQSIIQSMLAHFSACILFHVNMCYVFFIMFYFRLKVYSLCALKLIPQSVLCLSEEFHGAPFIILYYITDNTKTFHQ